MKGRGGFWAWKELEASFVTGIVIGAAVVGIIGVVSFGRSMSRGWK